MTQYLLFLPHDSAEEPTMATTAPVELEAAMAATGAGIEELNTSGALVFAGGLYPRAPEYLGGLWVIELQDQDAAVAWAAKASKALGGRIEVHAFQEVPA